MLSGVEFEASNYVMLLFMVEFRNPIKNRNGYYFEIIFRRHLKLIHTEVEQIWAYWPSTDTC